VSSPTHQPLRRGHVYRTGDLHGANPARVAKRLVAEGKLQRLGRGLFVHPTKGRFGQVPPDDTEVMRAFLDGDSFVMTGPERWNALGLGTTAVYAAQLVYNRKRTGRFTFGGRPFDLRRVEFPDAPTSEWFAIDLLEHADQAGASRAELERALATAVERGRFDYERLRRMADRFGSQATRKLVDSLRPRAEA